MDEPTANYSNSFPLFWFRMHLPILRLLWVTWDFEVRGSFLQDIVRGRKYLDQTSLNWTQTDSELLFFHTLFFRNSVCSMPSAI